MSEKEFLYQTRLKIFREADKKEGKKVEKVFSYIECHRDEYIKLLKDFCNQPSVSAENIGMEEMAALVKKTLVSLGAETEQIETFGYPIIYGEINQGKERVLTFYNHYDVQPVDPLDQWKTDPFESTIIDGKFFARGCADNKGSMLSRICAVDAYQKVYGKLPLNIKFIIEGEEEVGSPHLKKFSEKYPKKLRTNGIIWEGGSKNINGSLQIGLGVKGLCYVELYARGANDDLHSSNAAIIENPAWRLIWALSTLKNEKDEILIDGFYDTIKQPTQEDMEYLENIIYEEEVMKKSMGIKSFINNLTSVELKKKLLYEPTCNICGINSGYIGKGEKTVLPSSAKAKIDFRLVYNQKPDDIFSLLRKHLDNHGFSDIEIVYISGVNPYLTDSNSLIAKIVIKNVERIYKMPPVIYRNIAATSPMSVLCESTNIPAVLYGVNNDESNIHAPNENIYVKDYLNGIKLTTTVFHEFAKYCNSTLSN